MILHSNLVADKMGIMHKSLSMPLFQPSKRYKKYEFRIIIGRYDVIVVKKIDQSESVNKPVTKTGINGH